MHNPHFGAQLSDIAARYPSHLALSHGSDAWSYAELHQNAGLLARAFAGVSSPYCGLAGGAHPGIYAGVVACMCYGKTYVPLNLDESDSRLQHIVEATGMTLMLASVLDQKRLSRWLPNLAQALRRASRTMRLVLVDSEQIPTWCQFGEGIEVVCGEQLATMTPAALSQANPNAYLLFTSGSTGVPKGVEVTHSNLSAYVNNTLALYGPVPGDRFSQLAPLSFDFSVHDLFVPWGVGASTHVLAQSQSVNLGQFIREKALTFWASVPSTILYLQRLRQLTPGAFPSVRQTLFCGEPLLQSMAHSWHKAAPNSRIDNIYGPTEATVAVCGYQWQPEQHREPSALVPIGRAYPGTRLTLGKARRETVEANDEGELLIAGEQLVQGYWAGSPAPGDRFIEDAQGLWYRSGDWARRDPQGGYHFLGRCDDQLKVHGQRLERVEIETLLRKVTGHDDVAVVGWPVVHGNSVEGLVFFVAHHELTNLALRKRCQQLMSNNMWPSKILLGPLPKNQNGKTDYKALRQRLSEESRGRTQIKTHTHREEDAHSAG